MRPSVQRRWLDEKDILSTSAEVRSWSLEWPKPWTQRKATMPAADMGNVTGQCSRRWSTKKKQQLTRETWQSANITAERNEPSASWNRSTYSRRVYSWRVQSKILKYFHKSVLNEVPYLVSLRMPYWCILRFNRLIGSTDTGLMHRLRWCVGVINMCALRDWPTGIALKCVHRCLYYVNWIAAQN